MVTVALIEFTACLTIGGGGRPGKGDLKCPAPINTPALLPLLTLPQGWICGQCHFLRHSGFALKTHGIQQTVWPSWAQMSFRGVGGHLAGPLLRRMDHGELPSVPKGYLDMGGGRGRGAETGLAGGVLGFSWRLACHQSGLLDQAFLEGLSPQSRVSGTRLATRCCWGSCFGLAFSPVTRVRVLKVCVWGCVCMWMGVPVHVWLGVHGLPWLLAAAFQVIAANAFPVFTPWVGVRSTF